MGGENKQNSFDESTLELLKIEKSEPIMVN